MAMLIPKSPELWIFQGANVGQATRLKSNHPSAGERTALHFLKPKTKPDFVMNFPLLVDGPHGEKMKITPCG